MVEQSVLEGNDQLETDAPLWTDNRFDYSLIKMNMLVNILKKVVVVQNLYKV